MINTAIPYDMSSLLLRFGLVLAATLVVELRVAVHFRVGLRGLVAVALVNVMTNPSANLLLVWTALVSSGFHSSVATPSATTVVLVEALVVLLEWRLLVWSLAGRAGSSRRMLVLSTAMNGASVLFGVAVHARYMFY